MTRTFTNILIVFVFLALISACSAAPQANIAYDPEDLSFSGERALELETQFVTQFPYRDSGQPNNQLAAEWLQQQFTDLGLECHLDEWEVINYSRPVGLNNVVCVLAGESADEILITAHHDQSPDTIQGADNDGSGIAVLLHLAEVLASEPKHPYTLVFVSSDGEEYGMLGTRRYISTHPDTGNIIAGISLDNLGNYFYNNLMLAPNGQFRGYGPIWLLITAQEAARAAGDLWVPPIRAPFDQVLNQAVPISFMDQGPVVAAGVPAVGFAGIYPPEYAEQYWESYHSPLDMIDNQSADVLYQSGRIPEALIRELMSRDQFPEESGPYLYLENSGKVLRGLPLWLIFIGFVGLFFTAVYFKGGKLNAEKVIQWRNGLPHFLSLWLPLLGAFVVTYIMVELGVMDKYDTYPATPKDEPIFNPIWPAVIIFLLSLMIFFYFGRRWAGRYCERLAGVTSGQINSLAFLVIGVGAFYVLTQNPFSLLFLVPALFWFLIAGRRKLGKILDIILFLLGGLVVYALIYFFGFGILRNNFTVLWYLLMMFSIQEISFLSTVVITAIVGAGLSMIVNPPCET
jgi:hypothetical protein